jgi:hypothetical protein
MNCVCGGEGEFRLLKKGPFTANSPRFCRQCVNPVLGDRYGVPFASNNIFPKGSQYTIRYSVQQQKRQEYYVKIMIGSSELAAKQPILSDDEEGSCSIFVEGDLSKEGGYFPFYAFQDVTIRIQVYPAKFLKDGGKIVRSLKVDSECISQRAIRIKCK